MPTPSPRRFATSSASHRNGRGQPPRGSPPEALWRTRRNAFTLPSDEEVFKMRDEEKRQKEYRETQSKLKVWEKTTRDSLLVMRD